MEEKDNIKKIVIDSYSRKARSAKEAAETKQAGCCAPQACSCQTTGNASCCTPKTSCCSSSSEASCCSSASPQDYLTKIGYLEKEINNLPPEAIAGAAGCGNPTAIANLKQGETVLDLGSGGGVDVFIAAKKVGSTGHVIGVDITDEMLELARESSVKLGLRNVEFRKGDIEKLPVDDESVDVIISNCVINLAPDKQKVFREAYRVLKQGGRFSVSDIVTKGKLPTEVLENPEQWAACISGALEMGQFLGLMKDTGFNDIKIHSLRGSGQIYSLEVEGFKRN